MNELEQIEGNIRTWTKALRENPLNEDEKEECVKKIKEFELIRERILSGEDDS
jgi:lipid II:glycine glycyltransferase (peptidoglycan interpeptide bridge formation enzyme)